jgi:hypothetical protein
MKHEKGTRAAATTARAQEENQAGNYYTGPRNRAVTANQRYSMIQTAAYLRAEKRGFRNGDPAQDWFEAEREVDAMLNGADQKPRASTN